MRHSANRVLFPVSVFYLLFILNIVIFKLHFSIPFNNGIDRCNETINIQYRLPISLKYLGQGMIYRFYINKRLDSNTLSWLYNYSISKTNKMNLLDKDGEYIVDFILYFSNPANANDIQQLLEDNNLDYNYRTNMDISINELSYIVLNNILYNIGSSTLSTEGTEDIKLSYRKLIIDSLDPINSYNGPYKDVIDLIYSSKIDTLGINIYEK